ncbi:MAG: 50S ribosomal protein L17 [Pseudodesulfovibrio sp.]|uniref:50S ribosomal protein L17 n=1 Tax=Pseudodesulfovibrio sp. TaxID=2035812 RepID=UPI003D098D91
MRHRKSGRKLNRSNTHRAAMFKNMARALLTYEQIRTTEAKAKELRRIADKLITLAIRNDLHSRRQAYKVLGSHQMVQRLFDEIGPRFAEAGGGYTRIVKMSQPRKGDCAPMVIIELTKKAGEATTEAPAKEEPKKAPAKKAEKPAEKPVEKKEEPKEEPEAPAEETPEAAEKADEE